MRERGIRCHESLVFRRLCYSRLTVTFIRALALCSSPRISEQKRDFSSSKLSPVSLPLPFAFPLLIVTCVSVYSRWAHIGCAVAVPEVFFVNVNLREGINTDQITSARRKLVSGTDFFLFNLFGKVNVCFCNCVTPCTVLCNLFCHALFFLLSYALS